MTTVKERRRLDFSFVYRYCNGENLYTRGDNEDYSNMLMNKCNSAQHNHNISLQCLYDIAKDIKEHSDTNKEIVDIMEDLNRISQVWYEIED